MVKFENFFYIAAALAAIYALVLADNLVFSKDHQFII